MDRLNRLKDLFYAFHRLDSTPERLSHIEKTLNEIADLFHRGHIDKREACDYYLHTTHLNKVAIQYLETWETV